MGFGVMNLCNDFPNANETFTYRMNIEHEHNCGEFPYHRQRHIQSQRPAMATAAAVAAAAIVLHFVLFEIKITLVVRSWYVDNVVTLSS